MKKLLAILLFPVLLFAAQQIVTQDKSDPQSKSRISSITCTNGLIATTNCIPSYAVQGTATNNGTAGTVVKTGSGNKIDSSLLSVVGVNVTNQSWSLPASVTLQANTLSNLTSITTTTNSGKVFVHAQVYFALSSSAGGEALLRVTDGTKNWDVPRAIASLASGTDKGALNISFWDVLGGSSKTYTLKAASNGANVVTFSDTIAGQTTTNSTRFSVVEFYP